ncbi:FecR domain-containing protein [Anabaena sphaerica FACHB-251]|uniref:FecR domain-containing protein n=1 Tax=Anabaena sphaerica FACHB-251 TaxID=2692883 RepID=A0A926WL77_9NOST|nr:FecR domain-containing protein [Anabaena sphaerica]MBD2296625.1 FecR domain-containing protein [Anabaena sphaerica FACHB-251]
MKTWWTYHLIFVLVGLVSTLHASAADPLKVKVNRYLEVRRSIGQVIYSRGQTVKPVTSGMRLQSVGDTIITKQGSSAVLAMDIGTGFINISENTTVTVHKLDKGSRGERITELQVKSGQVRLQIRRLTHDTSRVEIRTPAGVAGVRGTDFGVSVQDDGKTGVGTKEGAVATSAQGQTVLVNAGFQNLTIPGEPPSPAVPLREDTRLNISQLLANGSQVKIVGTVDPVNLLMIAQQPLNIDPSGRFDITVPLPQNRKVEAVVITPLGKQQLYQLAVP